jgi:hypothetical protein
MLQHHFSKDVYNNGTSEQQEPSRIQCGSDLAPTKLKELSQDTRPAASKASTRGTFFKRCEKEFAWQLSKGQSYISMISCYWLGHPLDNRKQTEKSKG